MCSVVLVPERLWEFAPSAEAGRIRLPRSPTESKTCDYGPSPGLCCACKGMRPQKSPSVWGWALGQAVLQAQLRAWGQVAGRCIGSGTKEVVLFKPLLDRLHCITPMAGHIPPQRLRLHQRSGFFHLALLGAWGHVACRCVSACTKEVVLFKPLLDRLHCITPMAGHIPPQRLRRCQKSGFPFDGRGTGGHGHRPGSGGFR